MLSSSLEEKKLRGNVKQEEMEGRERGVIQVQKVLILLFHPEMYMLQFA